jgi:hypothetical protein
MSSSTPLDLNATAIIGLIEAGAYTPDILLSFSHGFLPIEQGEVVAVLAYLSTSTDDEVATTARETLSDTPSRVVVAFAENESASTAHLDLLAQATNDNYVLEALVRNRVFPDSSVAALARRGEPHVQDVIVTNQSRIIRAPEILDALLENPRLTPDARRRALEVREEFFDKKARLKAALANFDLEASEEEAPIEAIADLLALAETEPQPDVPVPELPEPDRVDEKKMSIWAQITQMTVGEKVLLAFRGDKTVRGILIRERNRLICSSTMRNPRMTLTEVENIAGMREVDQEVLRLVALKRDWISKYSIVLALCRNPRTPVGVVLPIIIRLTLRDLKGLKDDKGVSEVVRTTARKFFQARQKNA